MSAVRLSLRQIETEGMQSRAALYPEVVDQYRESLEDGEVFPPLVIAEAEGRFWLVDGFHRYEAYKRLGRLEVDCTIVKMPSKAEAWLYALQFNRDHGLRLTNADKRYRVQRLLRDPEWSRWSDREIARRVGVGHVFVSNLRKELLTVHGEQSERRTYVTRHGTPAAMNTANIGKTKPAHEPEPLDIPEERLEAAREADREEMARPVLPKSPKEIAFEAYDPILQRLMKASHELSQAIRQHGVPLSDPEAPASFAYAIATIKLSLDTCGLMPGGKHEEQDRLLEVNPCSSLN